MKTTDKFPPRVFAYLPDNLVQIFMQDNKYTINIRSTQDSHGGCDELIHIEEHKSLMASKDDEISAWALNKGIETGQRIQAAIRTAKIEAFEEAAKVVDRTPARQPTEYRDIFLAEAAKLRKEK